MWTHTRTRHYVRTRGTPTRMTDCSVYTCTCLFVCLFLHISTLAGLTLSADHSGIVVMCTCTGVGGNVRAICKCFFRSVTYDTTIMDLHALWNLIRFWQPRKSISLQHQVCIHVSILCLLRSKNNGVQGTRIWMELCNRIDCISACHVGILLAPRAG